jgi:hypothetical protein
MYDTPRTTEELLTMLAATPPRLSDLTEGLPAAQLLVSPEPGEWSAGDVLAYLRSYADDWGNCIHERAHIKQ